MFDDIVLDTLGKVIFRIDGRRQNNVTKMRGPADVMVAGSGRVGEIVSAKPRVEFPKRGKRGGVCA